MASSELSAQAHCPRPALAPLTSLVGTWKVDWRYRADSALVPVEGATATIQTAAGGCGVTLRMEGRAGATRKSMMAVFAAPTDDSLQAAYIDSDHGSVLVFGGRMSGDAIQLTWSHDYGTHVQIVKLSYSGLTPTAFSSETRMSPDGGASWVLVQRARYRRT